MLAAGLVVLVGGCSGIQKSGGQAAGDSNSALLERAQARWDAMVRGDFKAAYEFMSPGTRQTNSYEMFSGKLHAGFWKEAKVIRAECPEPDVCNVVADISYVFQGTRITTPLRETWTLSQGQWWFVQK